MKIYGLTGGIASGKSEASKRFMEIGIPVLDADIIAHEIIEPGGAATEKVIEAFGEGILTCGKIDRDKLGAIVFGNDEALKRLNAIVHPSVRMEIGMRSAALAEEGHEAIILDAALIAEDGKLGPEMSGLILVMCRAETRLERLKELRGMTEKEGMLRISAQTSPEKKLPLATWVIDNSKDIAHLRDQVDRIAEEF